MTIRQDLGLLPLGLKVRFKHIVIITVGLLAIAVFSLVIPAMVAKAQTAGDTGTGVTDVTIQTYDLQIDGKCRVLTFPEIPDRLVVTTEVAKPAGEQIKAARLLEGEAAFCEAFGTVR